MGLIGFLFEGAALTMSGAVTSARATKALRKRVLSSEWSVCEVVCEV